MVVRRSMPRRAWMVAAVIGLGMPGAVYAQGVLHIKVTVLDASQSPIAVPPLAFP